MKIARIREREPRREEVRSFFGLNRKSARASGESADEENISAENYPFLAPKRETVRLCDNFGICDALEVREGPVWVTETTGGTHSKLYFAGHDTGVILTAGKKRLVSMGTKILVFPDKIYYDTSDGSHGSLEAYFTSEDGVTVSYTLSRLDGGEYEYDTSPTAPTAPSDGALWCDTSVTPAALMKYSAPSDTWVAVDSTYVKISSPGIGVKFSSGDGVEISSSVISSLCSSHIIEDAGDDYIIVAGIIETPTTQTTPINISRRVPEIDFALEFGNRIWACRYGPDLSGNIVNEIYASKLGDPFNWNSFAGLVSDSYASGVGSNGAFTGAAVFRGNVMFFKERCVHKVFGNRPSSYQITTTEIRGVADGAGDSICAVDDVLYYASTDGVVAYDGTYPVVISEQLGMIEPSGCISSRAGQNLYVSAVFEGVRELYVYDTKKAVWHRYSPMNVEAMAGTGCGLLAAADGALYVIDSKDLGIGASDMTGYEGRTALSESWYFESGELTAEREDTYVERVEVTASVPSGAELCVTLIGDEGERLPVVTVRPTSRRTFTIPLVTGRHRRWRMRIYGTGRSVVYHIAKYVEKDGASGARG